MSTDPRVCEVVGCTRTGEVEVRQVTATVPPTQTIVLWCTFHAAGGQDVAE